MIRPDYFPIFRLCCVVCGILGASQDTFGQLRVVTYNTATSGENSSPTTPRSGMTTVLEAIGNQSTNGIAKPIDVLLLQEQATVASSTQAIVELLNDIYGDDIYARGRLDGATNGGGRGGIVYNTRTVDLLQERTLGRLSVAAQARETLRYTLRPIGYDERSDFYAYVNHYKSGTTATDRARRLAEATEVRRNADALGNGVQAIYAGDFNIRSCTEEMFEKLTGPGPGQAHDPVADFGNGCNWHENNGFRALHTQSPAASSHTGLVLGGVDDRLDFQLVTENLQDGAGLSLIPGSYHAFGNNGSHRLNQPINDSPNTAQPRNVLNALAAVSDHLPVVADYQLPAMMTVEMGAVPARVTKGTDLFLDVAVNNSAPALHKLGADELDYSLEFSALGAAPTILSNQAFAATVAEPHRLRLPTLLALDVNYAVNVRGNSQNAIVRTFSQAGSYTVVEPSLPSFDNQDKLQAAAGTFVVPVGDEAFHVPLSVFNLSPAGSAGLDLDALAWSAEPPLPTTLEPFDNLPGGARKDFLISVPTDELGYIENSLLLSVSDEDELFGEQSSQLKYTLAVRVALPGDANLDDQIDFGDFLVVSANFGIDGDWQAGDFDRNGGVDFGDFLVLSSNFGLRAQVATVPEPVSGGYSLVFALLLLAARRTNAR